MERLMAQNQFLSLRPNELFDLIKSDYLFAENEEIILEASINWLKVHKATRIKFLQEILENIRLSTGFLRERLVSKELIDENSIELLSYLNQRQEREEQQPASAAAAAKESFMKESRSHNYSPSGKIYVVGGMHFEGFMEIYDPVTNEWTEGEMIPSRRAKTGGTVVQNEFYILGGCNEGGDCLTTVEAFNPQNNQWLTKQSMTVARRYPAVTAIENLIYVCGGQNGNEFLNDVEFYDAATNSWKISTPMSAARKAAAAVAINGLIYVLGGFIDTDVATNTVERYNPNTLEWENIEPMTQNRAHHAAAVLEGKLFVCGGEDIQDEFDSVEVYDPKKETWKPLINMKVKRSKLALVSNREKLCAFGGQLEKASHSLEIYDPDLEEWSLKDSLLYNREGHCAGVIS